MSWVDIQKKNKHNNDYKRITQLEINFFLMRTECERATRCWLFGKLQTSMSVLVAYSKSFTLNS